MASIETFVDHNNETEHVKEINKIQIALMDKWQSDLKDENERYIEWIQQFSESFRTELDKVLDNEENFWEDFTNDEYREKFMKTMEQKLYDRV